MNTHKLGAIYFHDWKNSYIPNILHEIYYERVYDKFLGGKKDLQIADWGANIGLTSFFFKDYAKQVYAVEPSTMHLEAIEAMIKQNGITNITVCPYAISNQSQKTKFYHNENVTMYSLNDRVNNKNDFEEVETLTPSDFFKKEGIEHLDLLKFDTEGFESEIIVSDGFAEVAPKIDVIVGEYHNWTIMSKDQFAHAFRDLGFTFTWYPNTVASVFSATRI
jgi:FkbM family methyltransferase